jgi:hypothetical protein
MADVFGYSRCKGEYSYDIVVSEIETRDFRARMVNLTWRRIGNEVLMDVALQEQDGATVDEAVSKIDASVAAWVTRQGVP